ncbi:uncharacterized protein C8R40DRAFT_1053221 [Lentinula edodes]|uniref:uncharacterized protein n=1 Tax=Lentinula edodes TaxID=5353 RepID=UPI001E8D9A77|nr:uncharacterized protein C8R40DRAFT_1053221 [Lentinula edodes]KAH7872125.1 hypothetical protein C8R40DRAFT_1053221 [Lentinula edodes]
MSNDLPKIYKMPLEERFYDLDAEQVEFFRNETGIQDEEELKHHIVAVQTKAYSIYRYPCIRLFQFAKLRIARLPAYPDLLRLGRERKGAIFLDIPCCCQYVGNDTRKAVQDGYPIDNVVASDLHKDFWDLGHEMFKSTPESFPVPFIQGDVFDPKFLEASPPFTLGNPPATPVPTLNTLTTLNPLRGHLSACFCGAFFHLFSEDAQYQIAQGLAGLLSPQPGSMIFGVHGSRPEKGFWHPTGTERYMFCHSPDSWKDLWEGLFGGKENVQVKAALRDGDGGNDLHGTYPGNKEPHHLMEWSVTRI